MSDAAHRFTLHPSIDVDRLAADFAKSGRVLIRPFLSEADAAALAGNLSRRMDWRRVLNSGEKVFEIAASEMATLDAQQAAALDAAVNEAARDGFQYRYESIRVSDHDADRIQRGDLLDTLAQFLSSDRVLTMLGRIIASPDLKFADAQATRYVAGDFLTAHDDAVAGKNRHAAYVLGLTEGWRAEWGGLLLFHGGPGGIAEGFVPDFNAISLFAVPQPHSVSLVAPYAGAARISVTGWLRSGVP